MSALYEKYKADQSACLLDTFKRGVSCPAKDAENFGTGEGNRWQQLTKTCPAFATEYAAVLMRVHGGRKGEFGPLRNRAAEVRPVCNAMLKQVLGRESFAWEPALVALGCVGLIAWWCFTAYIPLKVVSLDGPNLRVSNYRKEIAIPLSEVKEVAEVEQFKQKLIVLSLKRPSDFGREIKFLPRAQLRLWKEHPMAGERVPHQLNQADASIAILSSLSAPICLDAIRGRRLNAGVKPDVTQDLHG